jgi:hypothetical protein
LWTAANIEQATMPNAKLKNMPSSQPWAIVTGAAVKRPI